MRWKICTELNMSTWAEHHSTLFPYVQGNLAFDAHCVHVGGWFSMPTDMETSRVFLDERFRRLSNLKSSKSEEHSRENTLMSQSCPFLKATPREPGIHSSATQDLSEPKRVPSGTERHSVNISYKKSEKWMNFYQEVSWNLNMKRHILSPWELMEKIQRKL